MHHFSDRAAEWHEAGCKCCPSPSLHWKMYILLTAHWSLQMEWLLQVPDFCSVNHSSLFSVK